MGRTCTVVGIARETGERIVKLDPFDKRIMGNVREVVIVAEADLRSRVGV